MPYLKTTLSIDRTWNIKYIFFKWHYDEFFFFQKQKRQLIKHCTNDFYLKWHKSEAKISLNENQSTERFLKNV